MRQTVHSDGTPAVRPLPSLLPTVGSSDAPATTTYRSRVCRDLTSWAVLTLPRSCLTHSIRLIGSRDDLEGPNTSSHSWFPLQTPHRPPPLPPPGLEVKPVPLELRKHSVHVSQLRHSSIAKDNHRVVCLVPVSPLLAHWSCVTYMKVHLLLK